MIKKATIITSEAFPFGMAGTNRIISMAKGFDANGIPVEVVSFYKYAEPGSKDINPAGGVFEGIKFRNVFRSQVKNACSVIRLVHEYTKPVLTFFYALKHVEKRSVVVYYAEKTWPAIALRIVSYAKRFVLIKEETEHPSVRIKNKTRFSKAFFSKFHYRFFDGLMVITQNLYDFFVETLDYRKPILLVPMIIDTERFDNLKVADSRSIVFSGELDDKKEGVTNLIKAFSLVSRKYPKLRLELFGSAPDKSQESHFFELVKNLDLESRVFFHGYKNRTEMTEALGRARLFVFSRPPSFQAHYGFSTKLGEYLATGKPVIVSKVGEIDRYLTDNENAFLCSSDPESIAGRIIEIQDSYELALKVGSEGKKTAMKYFNNKTELKRIIEFLDTFFKL